MTVAFWCVFCAGLMPYIAVGIAKWTKSYDNADPRALPGTLQGFRFRAHSAHLNSFEAFPFFAAGVIVATLAHAPQSRVDALAIIFLVARVVYLAFYLADLPTLRSSIWFVGFLTSAGLFFSAL